MGLFSFLKDAGSKILGDDAKENEVKAIKDAAEAAAAKARREGLLESIVSSTGIGVKDLDIDLADDTVVVYGQTETQSDKEKIVLVLGNVEGVAAVDDRISVVAPEPEATFYTVQSGDSLSKIAKAQYGDPMKYMDIFEANQPLLDDPNKIYPGQVLRIPAKG
jgi:nucleoid-associated protein YgaU